MSVFTHAGAGADDSGGRVDRGSRVVARAPDLPMHAACVRIRQPFPVTIPMQWPGSRH